MKNKKGFTLIELLMVAGIISLLASMVMFRVTEAKKRGEDAHMKAESSQVARAVMAYKDDHGGKAPGNLTSNGQLSTWVEGSAETGDEYSAAMQELVSGGYISAIPHSPSGNDYSYIISADGTQAVFAADLNYEYGGSGAGWTSCEWTAGDGGADDEAPCQEPPYPADYSDVYGMSYDYVGGVYLTYPKARVPNMPGTCDIENNYNYGFTQLAGILEYGEYDCIDLPAGIAQAQAVCDALDPISGNQCAGISGPYYNGVNGVFIYHSFEVDQANDYVQNHLDPYDTAYAEFDQCMYDHEDEYDEYGTWLGGGDGDEDEGICSGSSDSDFCSCI